MKINRIVLLTLALVSVRLTVGSPLEPIEQEIAQEAEAGLLHLPAEIQMMLLKELTKAETKEQALKNIKNLFETNRIFQLFAGDIAANKAIIYELAQKFFNGDLIKTALALNTPGAKLWLAEYLEDKKQAREAASPLFQALNNKDNRTAITLLTAGKNFNIRETKLGRTPLMIAVATNNLKLIPELLRGGADINLKDKQSNSALFYAARNGNLDAVKLLLENGASINSANRAGITPLYISIHRLHPNVAQYLIERGADITTLDSQGGTILMEAATHKFPELVQLLLSRNVDVNSVDSKGNTALLKAAYADKPEEKKAALQITMNLVFAGAQVNVATQDGFTPLSEASLSGNLPTVKFLLLHNANVNPSAGSNNPLMSAAYGGNLAIVKYLLDIGADINAVDTNANNALMYAINAPSSADEIFLELLKRGITNINVPEELSTTHVIWAAQNGYANLIPELFKKGANVNAQDAQGWTALHHAIINRHLEATRALLETPNINTNILNNDQIAPLSMAIGAANVTNPESAEFRNSLPEIIQKLLQKGANPNTPIGTTGLTPLMGAIFANRPDFVIMLLANGADKNMPFNGVTPKEIARNMGRTEIEELLK